MFEPEMVDTTGFAKDEPHRLCFSGGGTDEAWNEAGRFAMQAQAEALGVATLTSMDANGSVDKQAADIEGLVAGGNCDILIVSPSATATITPVVEEACEEIPVIVFAAGVHTDCPVSRITPIGGFAFGVDGAEFMGEALAPGDNVLMVVSDRRLGTSEDRRIAASIAFEQHGMNIVAIELADGDPGTTSTRSCPATRTCRPASSPPASAKTSQVSPKPG